MFTWREYLRRVAHSYPANRHCFSRSQVALQMHNRINAYFAAFPEMSRVKDGRPSGDEYFVFDRATYYMCIGANEAVVADTQRMPGGTSEDGVLHDDALAADGYGPALSDD